MSHPVSTAFAQALVAGGQNPLLRVSVLHAGEEVASTHAVSPYDVRVDGGSVQIQSRSSIRRSLQDLVFADETGAIIPITRGDLLDPLTGNELKVERGLRLPDGTEEFVPLIVCNIQNAVVTDTSQAIRLSASGLDRSKAVSRNKWRTPFEIAASTNIGEAIQAIIDDRLVGVGPINYNFEATTEVTGSRLILGGDDGSDPWRDAQNLAAGIGMELFFGPDGTCIMRTVPDPDQAPVVWDFVEGEASILLDPLNRSIDVDTLRNGAIVFSEATWLIFPLISEVWDDDATSPINRADIGEWPEKVGDPSVWTQAQCDKAALALYRQVHGVEEQLQWNTVPNPALDVQDIVTLETDIIGGQARLSLETLTVPLGISGVMPATTRRRRS